MKTILVLLILLWCAVRFPYENLVSIPVTRDLDPIEHQVRALAQCESSNRDITILDSNNRFSRGRWQMQDRTFKYLGERYHLPHNNISLDYEVRPLVYEALKRGEWKHWYNCGVKLGFNK